MTEGTSAVGRVGFHVRHYRHGRSGAKADRAGLLRESMRDLDPAAAAFFASENPNIVEEDTPANITRVNDGRGGWTRPGSIKDVIRYGDRRARAVTRKISEQSSTISTIVVHLPKTMCREVPGFYPGEGGGPRRSRWVAADEDEMKRFFDQVLDYFGSDVLSGGQAAIHGYSINVDESTPHIQILCDNLGPGGKDGGLRVDFSRNWTTHRDVVDESGKQINGRKKMANYQENLRRRMVKAGFPVTMEKSERAGEDLSLEAYGRLRDQQRRIEDERNRLVQAEAGLREKLAAERREMDEKRREQEEQAARLKDQAEELDRLRRQFYGDKVNRQKADQLQENTPEIRLDQPKYDPFSTGSGFGLLGGDSVGRPRKDDGGLSL